MGVLTGDSSTSTPGRASAPEQNSTEVEAFALTRRSWCAQGRPPADSLGSSKPKRTKRRDGHSVRRRPHFAQGLPRNLPMFSVSKLALAALLVNVVACSVAAESEVPVPVTEGPTPQALSNLAICGADTAASIVGADGSRLTFCTSNGREIVSEETSDGVPSILPKRTSMNREAHRGDACALDLFLAHSGPDVPVPTALKASCELRRGHLVDVGARKLSAVAVLQPERVLLGEVTSKTSRLFVAEDEGSKYCNKATGSAAFTTDFCTAQCVGSNPCLQACTPVNFASSVRQCAEVNDVTEDIVSCSGFTRVFVDVRDGSSDPFTTKLDRFVGANRHLSLDVFELGSWGQDSDIRVRASSLPGAGHKHAFSCTDF